MADGSSAASRGNMDVSDIIARARQKKEELARSTSAGSKDEHAAATSKEGGARSVDGQSARGNDKGKSDGDKRHRRDRSRDSDRDRDHNDDRHRRRHRSRSGSRRRRSVSRDKSRDESRRRTSPGRGEDRRGGRADSPRRRRSPSRSRDREYRRYRDRSRDRGYDDRDRDRDYYRGDRDRDRGGDRYRDGGDRYRGEDRRRDRRSGSRERDARVPAPQELLSKVLGVPIPGPGSSTSENTTAARPAGGSVPVIPSADAPRANGAPLQTSGPVDLQALLAKITNAAVATTQSAAGKIAREIYIGGLPQGIGLTALALKDFFNQLMVQNGLIKPGQPFGSLPVLSARMNDQGTFAFLEMRSPEETDAAMQLNGVPLANAPMKIGRPKAYIDRFGNIPSVVAMEMLSKGGSGPVGPPPGVAVAMSGTQPGVGGAPSLAALGISMGAGLNPNSSNLLASMGLSSSAALFGSSSASAATHGAAPAVAATTLPYIPAIFVSNLSPTLQPSVMNEVFGQFGSIKEVKCLAPHPSSGTQRMLVLYADPLATPATTLDAAIAGLQGLDMAGLAMKLEKPGPAELAEAGIPLTGPVVLAPQPSSAQYANSDASASHASTTSTLPSVSAAASTSAASGIPTRILELHNIILAGSLSTLSAEDREQELSEIQEDVAEEAGRHGRVTEVFMPPLTAAQSIASGADLSVPVYVVFEADSTASACAEHMRKRRFDGRPVIARYVSEGEYATVNRGGAATHHHYGGVSVPPPAGGESAGLTPLPEGGQAGAPEDGLTLPPSNTAADLD